MNSDEQLKTKECKDELLKNASAVDAKPMFKLNFSDGAQASDRFQQLVDSVRKRVKASPASASASTSSLLEKYSKRTLNGLGGAQMVVPNNAIETRQVLPRETGIPATSRAQNLQAMPFVNGLWVPEDPKASEESVQTAAAGESLHQNREAETKEVEVENLNVNEEEIMPTDAVSGLHEVSTTGEEHHSILLLSEQKNGRGERSPCDLQAEEVERRDENESRAAGDNGGEGNSQLPAANVMNSRRTKAFAPILESDFESEVLTQPHALVVEHEAKMDAEVEPSNLDEVSVTVDSMVESICQKWDDRTTQIEEEHSPSAEVDRENVTEGAPNQETGQAGVEQIDPETTETRPFEICAEGPKGAEEIRCAVEILIQTVENGFANWVTSKPPVMEGSLEIEDEPAATSAHHIQNLEKSATFGLEAGGVVAGEQKDAEMADIVHSQDGSGPIARDEAFDSDAATAGHEKTAAPFFDYNLMPEEAMPEEAKVLDQREEEVLHEPVRQEEAEADTKDSNFVDRQPDMATAQKGVSGVCSGATTADSDKPAVPFFDYSIVPESPATKLRDFESNGSASLGGRDRGDTQVLDQNFVPLNSEISIFAGDQPETANAQQRALDDTRGSDANSTNAGSAKLEVLSFEYGVSRSSNSDLIHQVTAISELSDDERAAEGAPRGREGSFFPKVVSVSLPADSESSASAEAISAASVADSSGLSDLGSEAAMASSTMPLRLDLMRCGLASASADNDSHSKDSSVAEESDGSALIRERGTMEVGGKVRLLDSGGVRSPGLLRSNRVAPLHMPVNQLAMASGADITDNQSQEECEGSRMEDSNFDETQIADADQPALDSKASVGHGGSNTAPDPCDSEIDGRCERLGSNSLDVPKVWEQDIEVVDPSGDQNQEDQPESAVSSTMEDTVVDASKAEGDIPKDPVLPADTPIKSIFKLNVQKLDGRGALQHRVKKAQAERKTKPFIYEPQKSSNSFDPPVLVAGCEPQAREAFETDIAMDLDPAQHASQSTVPGLKKKRAQALPIASKRTKIERAKDFGMGIVIGDMKAGHGLLAECCSSGQLYKAVSVFKAMKFAGLAESGKAFHLMHEAVLGLGAIDTTFITALARILCEDYEVAQEEGTPLNLPPSELAIDVSSQAVNLGLLDVGQRLLVLMLDALRAGLQTVTGESSNRLFTAYFSGCIASKCKPHSMQELIDLGAPLPSPCKPDIWSLHATALSHSNISGITSRQALEVVERMEAAGVQPTATCQIQVLAALFVSSQIPLCFERLELLHVTNRFGVEDRDLLMEMILSCSTGCAPPTAEDWTRLTKFHPDEISMTARAWNMTALVAIRASCAELAEEAIGGLAAFKEVIPAELTVALNRLKQPAFYQTADSNPDRGVGSDLMENLKWNIRSRNMDAVVENWNAIEKAGTKSLEDVVDDVILAFCKLKQPQHALALLEGHSGVKVTYKSFSAALASTLDSSRIFCELGSGSPNDQPFSAVLKLALEEAEEWVSIALSSKLSPQSVYSLAIISGARNIRSKQQVDQALLWYEALTALGSSPNPNALQVLLECAAYFEHDMELFLQLESSVDGHEALCHSDVLGAAKINVLASSGMREEALALVEKHQEDIKDRPLVFERCMETLIQTYLDENDAQEAEQLSLRFRYRSQHILMEITRCFIRCGQLDQAFLRFGKMAGGSNSAEFDKMVKFLAQ